MSGVTLSGILSLISWLKVVKIRPQFGKMFSLLQLAVILWGETLDAHKFFSVDFHEIDASCPSHWG